MATKSKPYIDEEFEKLIPRAKTALNFMRNTPLSDDKFDEVFLRFTDFIEYLLDCLEPIPEMRIIADKRHSKPAKSNMGDITIKPSPKRDESPSEE